ncbi:potassium channel subfamily K member 18-like [Chelonus insularis]|uniref:potassium channel subfamily K member 18-like n=1 Tax=Chelonus insularis TaxID=460826 RepID=UPI00158B9B3B|nr:potassium channel subfamily K member 18-like [Chelonus insularis]XP_034943401.1 potassium channel subfamily K member 18-like [Chelonus insularis]XP_034943411.1 potassium channel subfamily K member 18-like [Chelonus insularis]XP_034943419.1 potassium channel subfamily K member 18-like [Chelonus insularis]
MQISASDYYQRTPRSCPGRRASQLTGAASSTAITNSNSNTTGNATENSFRISTTVKASELWCCCCNYSTTRSTKTPGFLACLGICVLVFGYTLLGAFAFMALEGGFKIESPSDDAAARQLRANTVERLWGITELLNVLYKENWTRLAEREILDFQEKMARSLNHDRSSFSVYGGTIQRSSKGHDRLKDSRPMSDRRWTFGSSLLYSLTLITTIGYGSVAPRTIWGRVITVVYALAGIPLMLVYLSTIGDVFARSFRRLYGRLCHRNNDCGKKQKNAGGQYFVSQSAMSGLIGKSYHRYDNHIETTKFASGNFYSSKDSSCDELGVRATGGAILLDRDGLDNNLYLHSTSSNNALQDMNSEKKHLHACSQMSLMPSTVGYGTDTICVVRIPISLCLLIILLYVCAGTFMFHRLEGWNLLESSYFCFTSLGTIGFGDLVPAGRNAPSRLLEELSLCACSLYILVGMGLIAMCFNLMQEEVVRVVRVFGRTCGTAGGMTAGSLGATGLKSELGEDGNIGGSSLTDGCRQSSEHDDNGIAMSIVSSS